MYYGPNHNSGEVVMQKIIIYITLALTLAACAYQIPIQQGNIVSEEKLAQLQVGMDQRQVVFIMGTPMLQDPFHAERWDYIYRMRPSKGESTAYGATLWFHEGVLQRIEKSGEIPAEEFPKNTGENG